MSIYNLNGDLKIEQLKAEQTVYAGDGAKCIVKATTTTTVRVWSPARSSKGIDSETWYTFREFNMLFSLKDPLACNIESCEYWFCKSHNTCFFPNITRLRVDGEKRKAEAQRQAEIAKRAIVPIVPKKRKKKKLVSDNKVLTPLSVLNGTKAPKKTAPVIYGPYKITEKRRAVFAKTDGKCYICQTPIFLHLFTIDHVLPKSKGGSEALKNLLPSADFNWLSSMWSLVISGPCFDFSSASFW